MGLYNYCQEKLPAPLNQKGCFLCNNPITPFNTIPELDAFQYKCSYCNPKVVIEISGSMLSSTLYDKLIANVKVKANFIRRIRSCKKKSYLITTIDVSKLNP